MADKKPSSRFVWEPGDVVLLPATSDVAFDNHPVPTDLTQQAKAVLASMAEIANERNETPEG